MSPQENKLQLFTKLKIFLVVQVLIAAVSPFIFQWIPTRQVAALVAGGAFIALGILGLVIYRKFPRPWATFGLFAIVFHLFLVSAPMVFMRVLHWGEDFSQVPIWGIPGPVFHKTGAFASLLLFFATLGDMIRLRKKSQLSRSMS